MLKVLVVEDEFYLRRGTVLTIDWAKLNCVVAGEAANGEEGLALARSLQPDIIITDIRMPRMDGLTMVRTLREEGCEAKVIILTAYSDFDYARNALRLGVTDYLLKPYHDGELEETVLRLIREPGNKESEEDTLPAMQVKVADASGYSQKAIYYIGEHYGDSGISIGSIAGNLCISEGHLSHVFKKETGFTLVEYLAQYRIHKAMELLRSGEHKVYEVAYAVGYRDVAYFSSTFRKLTGKSPSEYQDGHRK